MIDGGKYSGHLDSGLPHGQGMMEYPNQDIYRGYWNNGKREGQGELKFANTEVYEGTWS